MAKQKPITTKQKPKEQAEGSATPPIPQVQLRDLRLSKSECSLGAGPVPKLQQSITLSMTPNDIGPNPVNVTVDFVLFGQTDDGQEGLRIAATFRILFHVEAIDKITSEQMGELLSSVVLNVSWPYWREFVQSMTVRMGLPPLRLPLLRQGQLADASLTIREGTVRKTSLGQQIKTTKTKKR